MIMVNGCGGGDNVGIGGGACDCEVGEKNQEQGNDSQHNGQVLTNFLVHNQMKVFLSATKPAGIYISYIFHHI